MATEQAADQFLAHFESLDKNGKSALIRRGKSMGGKFALLARILEGDDQAALELEEHIKAGRVNPDRDLTMQTN